MKSIVHHCFKIIIAKRLFFYSEGDKLSQIGLHKGSSPMSGNSRVGNDFLFILLQVPFCSNRWSAPGQYLKTNVNFSFQARYAEQEKQVKG